VAPRLVLRLQTRQERSAVSIGCLSTVPPGHGASWPRTSVISSLIQYYTMLSILCYAILPIYIIALLVSETTFPGCLASQRARFWNHRPASPAASLNDGAQNMRCLHSPWPDQTECGACPRFAERRHHIRGPDISLPSFIFSAYYASHSEASDLATLSLPR
jgi:hypothetical protein